MFFLREIAINALQDKWKTEAPTFPDCYAVPAGARLSSLKCLASMQVVDKSVLKSV